MVSTEAPDPFGNAVGRWYYVLAKGLCERGHRVRWLAAYTREAFATRARARLQHHHLDLTLYPYPTRSWSTSKWQTLRRPYGYFISDSLAQDLKAELRRGYDILHLESAWAGWLGLGAPRSLLSVLSLASVDFARTVPRSVSGLVSKVLMKRTEQRLISQFDTIRVLTPRDAQVVQGLNRRARIVTIPLAIDPSLYPFKVEQPPNAIVGLIGSMHWLPTRSAAVRLLTSVWPRVRASRSDARLLLVGWGARKSLARFADAPGVTILEDVADSEPYFRRLSVLAYPAVSGSGMKVKLLEAMAYGVPVVTTSEGVVGIDAADGVHAFVSDEDEILADRIVSLLGPSQTGRRMRLAARRLVEDRYSPIPVISQIESLYDEICQSGS